MGNDGGTIIKKIKVTNAAGTELGEDDEYTLLTTCALSGLELYNQPIVSDYLGKLYLKEKVIEYLLEKKDLPTHITTLKDVIDLKVTWKLVDSKPHITCPITQLDKTKNSEYSYLRNCGCLVSYKLLKKISTNCPNCDTPFTKSDIVLVNPVNNKNYTLLNQSNYDQLISQGLTHSKKKKKRRKETTEKQEKKRKHN